MSDAELSARDAILIVDDQPDVHAVTKLSLKSLSRPGRRLELLSAASGAEAVEAMRANPDVAVVLLDVVMESDSAGLEACRRIREELDNHLVRILLRTGQPGAAPERETIDGYDIDGYLAKAEVTSAKLYSAVRTALRAHDQLRELDRHRRLLTTIHECAVALHSFEPLEATLDRILAGATTIARSPFAILSLDAIGANGDRRRFLLHRGGDPLGVEDVRAGVVRARAEQAPRGPQDLAGGLLVPLELHRELGYGFVWVAGRHEAVVRQGLSILASHAANALYSSVAVGILRAERGPLFEHVDV